MDQGISGKALFALQEIDLEKLGINLGTRKIIIMAITELKGISISN